jgi:predicted nucleic acid-binding protein
VILVDTSVWVDHLRRGNDDLGRLLVDEQVLCHPFVVGELACGRLSDRAEILARLQALPQANSVEHQEALAFVEMHRLIGAGLGWVDVNLLASATLSAASLWSFDRSLMGAARRLGLSG